MELSFSPKEFFEKSKKLFRTPVAFFKDVEKEKGWKDAFTYSIVISAIAALFGVLEITLLYPLFQNQLQGVFTADNKPQLLDILPAFFVSAVVVVLLGFVWSGALHLWLKLFRIKGDYWSAYKAYTYSRAPLSFFGWIPYLGGIFSIYSIYLLVVGMSVHYKLTKKKAFLMIIVPLALLFILQTVLYSFATQVTP